MPTPFAALESRVNAAALAKLANATATIAGQAVDGVLSQAFVEQLGVEGLRPTFTAIESALPPVAHGAVVTIGAVTYSVVGVQPDAGVTVLILERA